MSKTDWKVGDKVWIYEFGDPGQCIEATITEKRKHGFYSLDTSRYLEDGTLQKREDIGYVDRMWATGEEAIEATTQEFKEELQESTKYYTKEQSEWRNKHVAETTESR